MFSSASAMFWSYNDSWPVSNGWSIVDYWLRRKLAYWTVRRAYRPVTVVVAEENGNVGLFGVNDTPTDWTGSLRYGLFRLQGGRPKDETQAVTLPANASTLLAQFPCAEWESLGLQEAGAFAVLLEGERPVAQHRLFRARFCDLALAPPEIQAQPWNGLTAFQSEAFVWGVCLDVDGEQALPDNCFDLIPGLPYVVDLPWEGQAPRVVRVGSSL